MKAALALCAAVRSDPGAAMAVVMGALSLVPFAGIVIAMAAM